MQIFVFQFNHANGDILAALPIQRTGPPRQSDATHVSWGIRVRLCSWRSCSR